MKFKPPANVGIRSRRRQVVVLIVAILAGMVIASSLEASDFRRANDRHYRQKYRAQIRRAGKECRMLARNRNTPPKATIFAAHKPKRKAQPEVGEAYGQAQTPGAPQNRHLGN